MCHYCQVERELPHSVRKRKRKGKEKEKEKREKTQHRHLNDFQESQLPFLHRYGLHANLALFATIFKKKMTLAHFENQRVTPFVCEQKNKQSLCL